MDAMVPTIQREEPDAATQTLGGSGQAVVEREPREDSAWVPPQGRPCDSLRACSRHQSRRVHIAASQLRRRADVVAYDALAGSPGVTRGVRGSTGWTGKPSSPTQRH